MAASELAVPLLSTQARVLPGSIARRTLGSASAEAVSGTGTPDGTQSPVLAVDIGGCVNCAEPPRRDGRQRQPSNATENANSRVGRVRSTAHVSGQSSPRRRTNHVPTAAAASRPVRWISTTSAVTSRSRSRKPSTAPRRWTASALRSRSAMSYARTAIAFALSPRGTGTRHRRRMVRRHPPARRHTPPEGQRRHADRGPPQLTPSPQGSGTVSSSVSIEPTRPRGSTRS